MSLSLADCCWDFWPAADRDKSLHDLLQWLDLIQSRAGSPRIVVPLAPSAACVEQPMPTSRDGCSQADPAQSHPLPTDPKCWGCCYCGMFPPLSTHSRLLLVVSSSILPSSKTNMSTLQMVLIITIVSPTVLMAVGFLSSISNVWNALLAPTTLFSGSSVGWFWLLAGIPAGLVMMKQNLDCRTGWVPSCHSLLAASCAVTAAEARPRAGVQEQPIDHVCPSSVSSEKVFLKI